MLVRENRLTLQLNNKQGKLRFTNRNFPCTKPLPTSKTKYETDDNDFKLNTIYQ